MKKSIIAAGAASAVLAAMPMAGVFALSTGPYTDTLTLTIEDTCEFVRTTSGAHASGADGGSWSSDTLSKTVVAGNTYAELGTSSFHVTCNNTDGYTVTMAAEDLENADNDTIPYAAAAVTTDSSTYSASKDGNTTYLANNGIVSEANQPTASAGVNFTITYGAGIKDGQAAGEYTGDIVYTFTAL